MVVSYSRNAGLALDADPALIKERGAQRLACWVENTELRRLAFWGTMWLIAFNKERDPHVCCW